MKKVIILALFLMMSLCSCNGKNLEKIQAMMVNDAFVYTDGPSTWHKNEQLGTEDIREESSLMEFYEDGTFYIGTIKKNRHYVDGELVYYIYHLNMTYQTTEKLYGTFELKYDKDDNTKIIVVLNITKREYERYDGSTTETEIDEQYTDTKEYTVHLEDGVIRSIGFYDSQNYPLLSAVN